MLGLMNNCKNNFKLELKNLKSTLTYSLPLIGEISCQAFFTAFRQILNESSCCQHIIIH